MTSSLKLPVKKYRYFSKTKSKKKHDAKFTFKFLIKIPLFTPGLGSWSKRGKWMRILHLISMSIVSSSSLVNAGCNSSPSRKVRVWVCVAVRPSPLQANPFNVRGIFTEGRRRNLDLCAPSCFSLSLSLHALTRMRTEILLCGQLPSAKMPSAVLK